MLPPPPPLPRPPSRPSNVAAAAAAPPESRFLRAGDPAAGPLPVLLLLLPFLFPPDAPDDDVGLDSPPAEWESRSGADCLAYLYRACWGEASYLARRCLRPRFSSTSRATWVIGVVWCGVLGGNVARARGAQEVGL